MNEWVVVGLALIAGVALIFGAWSANAAERKGYERSMGWMLGILLGVIGRIIVGVMRDKRVGGSVPATYPVPQRSDV